MSANSGSRPPGTQKTKGDRASFLQFYLYCCIRPPSSYALFKFFANISAISKYFVINDQIIKAVLDKRLIHKRSLGI